MPSLSTQYPGLTLEKAGESLYVGKRKDETCEYYISKSAPCSGVASVQILPSTYSVVSAVVVSVVVVAAAVPARMAARMMNSLEG